MKRSLWLVALLLMTLALGLAGRPAVTRAQTSPGHDLSWHVLAGGGGPAATAGHQVNSTLGQLAIGPAASPGHSLGSGYWYGMRREGAAYKIYLPLVVSGS